MLTSKTHGAWFLLILAIVVLAFLWFVVTSYDSGAKPGKFVSLTLGETESCDTDVGGCPFHSIQAFSDGSYVVGGDLCNDKRQCKGRLTDQETIELKKILQEVDIAGLLVEVSQCQQSGNGFTPRTQPIDWVILQSDNVTAESARDFMCENQANAVKFKNLINSLKSILKLEHRALDSAK